MYYLRKTSEIHILRALHLSIVLNALLFIFKVVGGIVSRSTALLADGSDSLLNVISNMITFKYYHEARRPPDEEHPYGHLKYEAFASMLVLILMSITLSFIAFMTVDRIITGIHVKKLNPIGIFFAVASFILNITTSFILRVFGKGSMLLKTEARHLLIDVFESVIVLVGVALGIIMSGIFDILATMMILSIVAYYIMVTLKEIKHSISDVSPPTDVLKKISEIIMDHDGVVGYHSLRARQLFDRIFADVHVIVNKGLSISEAHSIATSIEEKLKKAFNNKIDIVIHVEPEGEANHHE
ncbi:MAG: hypothetical protein DRZ82_03540 [Thermoprotei archaeon]|nr:MAG: hypothetical protein DRZ82_03540 [Thermoprotei archaeon]